jgi:hypothetical protein
MRGRTNTGRGYGAPTVELHDNFIDIFITCLFDDAYQPLFRSIGFTTLWFPDALRFEPATRSSHSIIDI